MGRNSFYVLFNEFTKLSNILVITSFHWFDYVDNFLLHQILFLHYQLFFFLLIELINIEMPALFVYFLQDAMLTGLTFLLLQFLLCDHIDICQFGTR